MNNKLFIGSLSWGVTSQDLQTVFAVYGELVAENTRVVLDKMTGKSRGFGFVEYVNASDAEKAMNDMNGKEIKGRAINISFAKPLDQSDSRGRRDYRNSDRN
jgi:RNA recognition motif-containing protein